MLFRKINLIKGLKKINYIILLVFLSLLFMFTLTACELPEGSIMIYEDIKGTGITINLKTFSSNEKLEMELDKESTVQVEVKRDSGVIALTVSGKKGSEPYTGNDLQTGIFTFTVSETDNYIFKIKGENGTGKIIIKKLDLNEVDVEFNKMDGIKACSYSVEQAKSIPQKRKIK